MLYAFIKLLIYGKQVCGHEPSKKDHIGLNKTDDDQTQDVLIVSD